MRHPGRPIAAPRPCQAPARPLPRVKVLPEGVGGRVNSAAMFR